MYPFFIELSKYSLFYYNYFKINSMNREMVFNAANYYCRSVIRRFTAQVERWSIESRLYRK